MPMPYLIALIPLLWVPSLALAAISVCVHAWTPLVAFMLTAVASVARLWPYWAPTHTRETVRETSSGAATEPRTARSLRVMTVNCRYGRADAHAIVREVRQRHIDVLATQETTDDLVERLREAGLDSLLPHRQLGTSRPTDNGGYNALFSRFEPSRSAANLIDIPAADVPSMTIDLPTSADTQSTGNTRAYHVTLASAHPKSPMRGCPEWSAGIRGLSAIADLAERESNGIGVVMGDLNSSIEHPSFRSLLANGLHDASRTQATHAVVTFPSWLTWPHIELDHVLFTNGLSPSKVGILPHRRHRSLRADRNAHARIALPLRQAASTSAPARYNVSVIRARVAPSTPRAVRNSGFRIPCPTQNSKRTPLDIQGEPFWQPRFV